MPRRLRVEVGADLRELLLRGGDLRLGRARRGGLGLGRGLGVRGALLGDGGPLLGCGLGRRFGRAYAFFMRRSERRELAFVRLGRDLHRRLGVLGRGLGLRELAFMSLGELLIFFWESAASAALAFIAAFSESCLAFLWFSAMAAAVASSSRTRSDDRRCCSSRSRIRLLGCDALGGRALRRGAQLRLGRRSGRDGGLRRRRLLLELRVLGK